MKLIHLPAILVALALALPACGGDDGKDQAATPAAGTGTVEQTDQPRSEPEPSPRDRSSSRGNRNGDGGSSAADAERAAKDSPATSPGEGGTKQGAKQDRPKAKRTPNEEIAALSPAERRKLHRDLFEQGRNLCYAYGPEELARSNNLPSTDPETVARLWARVYEAATPALILPYQQGCLAGFKRFARNPPKN